MIKYRFGLGITKSREWVSAQWQEYGREDRKAFVEDVLLKPGPHLLPLFGVSSETTELRRRHLENLLQAFGKPEIVDCLRKELDPILDSLKKTNP